MEQGINKAYETIEDMLNNYKHDNNSSNILEQMKAQIAVELLEEALVRIESLKNEIGDN